MPTRINPNYKPSHRVYELMVMRFPELTIERAREFIGHELPEMIMYWTDRTDAGASKANWNSTCLNWMKRVYENKREKQHGSHQATKSDDLFGGVLRNMNLPEKIITESNPGKETWVEQEYKAQDITLPKYKDKTSPEAAFAEIRKLI